MKALFVGSELTPIAKVGGLGDVMGALPKALAQIGVDVSIVIPRYGFIKKAGLKLVDKNIVIPHIHTKEKISLYETVLINSKIKVFLVDNADYWTNAPEPYYEQTAFAGAKREIQRFVFFSKAVFVLIQRGVLKADIVHTNDWHTGALVALLKQSKRNLQSPISNFQTPKIVFTIHNLSNQGRWNAAEIDGWFLGKGEQPVFKKLGNDYDFIAEGILNADKVTTVSQTYAKEMLTKQYGEGLDGLLKTRVKDLVGIINGIDYDFFNPAEDKFIFQNYTGATVNLKAINKSVLRKALGLEHVSNAPLFGLVARLTGQKGIDLVIETLDRCLKNSDAQFIFLGKGVPIYEQALVQLAEKNPERTYSCIGFDESLAHKVYAASDFFLMPSRFEPSGLGQMIAMRYGTIPIVRSTGGLHDTVRHLKTGFVFKHATAQDLYKTIVLAVSFYKKHIDKLSAIQKNCFNEDFSFSRSAEAYLKLYELLIKKPRI